MQGAEDCLVLFKNNTFYITAGKEFDLLIHCRPRKMSKIKFIASGADPGFIKMLRTLAKGMGMGGVGIGYPGELYFHRTCNFRHDANLRFWCLAFKCQNIAVIRQSDRRSWILAMLKVVNFIYSSDLCWILFLSPPFLPLRQNLVAKLSDAKVEEFANC